MTENKIEIKRHIGKTISYRFLDTLQTIIISYIFTGNFVISSSIGIVELCVKPLIYFFCSIFIQSLGLFFIFIIRYYKLRFVF